MATENHYALGQKAEIIVEMSHSVTRKKVKDEGEMIVVTASRLAAVHYYHEVKRYMQKKGHDDTEIFGALSGSVVDPDGVEYTEPSINVGHDGERVTESQVKEEFHDYGDVLVDRVGKVGASARVPRR